MQSSLLLHEEKKIQIDKVTLAKVVVVLCGIVCQKSKIGKFIHFPCLDTILCKSQHMK